MYKIENQYLKIVVSSKGAELQSLFDKEMNKEVLWYGDEKFWKRHSPLLFPNVGRHYKNCCYYNGRRFDTDLHGFAKDSEFICIKQEDNLLTFSLRDDEATRAYFPFSFVLNVTYRLTERTLEVVWDVENNNEEEMYFTIGGHPGFNVPILEDTRQTEYKLLFNRKEALEYRLVYGDSCNADGEKTYRLPLDTYGAYSGCAITEHMFDKDALILENEQVRKVTLYNKEKQAYLSLHFNAPVVGLWSPPAKNAPFVCIEPWYGRCDRAHYTGEYKDKDWMQHLQPEEIFQGGYTIEIDE